MLKIKTFLFNLINKLGYKLVRHQLFYRENLGTLVAPKGEVDTTNEIVDEIFSFHENVPPFYDENVIKPLRIEGAWKGNILSGRKAQLEALKNNDKENYKKLLNNMFKNEMIYSMWEGDYFKESFVNKTFPSLFKEWVDGYHFLTKRPLKNLIFKSLGSPWGMNTKDGLIKLIDPAQGIKAQQMINILNLLQDDKNKLTVCDLGSGFGGDVEKLARWYDKPLRIILIDIPLNLTTAYAYIKSGFEDADCHLVSKKEDVSEIINRNAQGLEFIFLPTLFVEELRNVKLHILHNHGSFSEMDADTVNFYLDVLLKDDTDFMVEINSNRPATLAKTHLEVSADSFTIPESHKLFSRSPTWLTPKGHRYLCSIYANKKSISPSSLQS